MNEKIRNGQFYTKNNPFDHRVFKKWSKEAFSADSKILEPFAGANHIVDMLRDSGTENEFVSFDISPGDSKVKYRDTIENYPKNYKTAITNPPYLAKNSATRKSLKIDFEGYDDLYKVCIKRMLNHNDFVAAIIPESFITSGQFRERLFAVISLTYKMFDDTTCPVCLALWNPEKQTDFEVYSGNTFIGKYSKIIQNDILSKQIKTDLDISFNCIDGQIGLRGLDNSRGESIYFCNPEEIPAKHIKPTSRGLTRIRIDKFKIKNKKEIIKVANEIIDEHRKNTHDVFLTSFKGLRKDGKYRRRLDFQKARKILNIVLGNEI